MALLAGILIGLLLALPPGGIVLVGWNLSMTMGFRRAVPYAYGTLLGDIAYALLAMFAAQAVTEFWALSMETYPAVILTVQGLLVTGLCGYGVHLLVRRTPVIERNADGSFALTAAPGTRRRRGPFLLGVGLNLSNIFSPTFLVALAILTSQAEAFGVLRGNPADNIFYAVGFGIGNTIYLQLGMKLVERYTRSIQRGQVLRLQKLAGAAFAGIAGMLLFHVVSSWTP